MVYLKDSVNIYGKREASTREISNTEWDVDTDIGLWIKNKVMRNMKGTIKWIRNQVMVFISGRTVGTIRVILKTIIATDLANYLPQIMK